MPGYYFQYNLLITNYLFYDLLCEQLSFGIFSGVQD